MIRNAIAFAVRVALLLTFAGPAFAAPATTAQIGRGKLLFLRCSACHAAGPGEPQKIGPNLAGVVGRKAGSLPGYAYSTAMKAQNFVWDDAALDHWLIRPNDVVPNTAMAFGGVPALADRQAIIAYLNTLKP